MNINTNSDIQNNALSLAATEPGLNLDSLDSDGNAQLHIACKKGDIDSISRLLANGANIETKNRDGDTALHIASSLGFLNIVNLLLEKNAQVDSQNNLQETPLQLACWYGNLKEAQALFVKGADIKNMGGPNGSALHLAAANNHLEIVHWLLDNGVDVDQEDHSGQTALFEACLKDHLSVIQALLAKNANVNKKDKKGITPLLCTATGKKVKIAEELLKHKALVDVADEKGFTPLLFASASGCLELVQLLLAHGADRNKQTKTLDSPLHVAVVTLQLDVVKFLVEQEGIAIDSVNIRGNTPLMNACIKGSLEIAQTLIAKGANINKKGHEGFSPLHFAASHRHLSMIQELIKEKAVVNIQNDNGCTPLHIACLKNYLDVATLLLNAGAEPNKENMQKETALIIAVVKGFPTLVKTLLERNLKESQFFKLYNDTSVLHTLFSYDLLLEDKMLAELFLRLSKNCDVTFKNKKGVTALKGLLSAEVHLTKKVQNILKIIFADFGALDEILNKYDGSNRILFDFKLKAEELISHPQNTASANPLAIALLFDDRPLAYAIASKLSSPDFLSMCCKLEKSYPKVPVAKFLYEIFITCPEVFQPTLPSEHIKALFGFLREKMDVSQRNEDLTTPLYKMLFAYEKESCLDQDAQSHVKKFEKEHAVKIVAALFSDFPALTKRVSENLNGGLFDSLREHPEELLSSDNQKANPFEFVFLFNDLAFARKLTAHMSKDGFEAFKLHLAKSYPKSNAHEFMFNVEYDVNRAHLGKILSGKIPPKPQGSEPNDFVILFNSINFSNPEHILGRNKTHDDLKKIILDFVSKVKARKGIQGDHAEGSLARKEFYDTLENGICGIAHFFQKTPPNAKIEEQKIRVMKEFIKDVVYCGPKIYATTVRQYNNVVRNYEPTFDNLLYSKTTDQRSLIADSLVPMNEQSVHDYLLLVKYVGKDLGLSESTELSEFDDLFATSGHGINPAKIKKSFFEIYTPFAILNNVQNEITNDEEFREQYTTWWQKNAPQSYKSEPLDPNDVIVQKGQTVEEVIDAVRRQNFVLEEVYENVRENRFKLNYITESLQQISVIQHAVSFKTD